MKRQRSPLGELCELVKGTSPISKTSPGNYPLVTTGEEHKTADSFQFDTEGVCIPLISSTGHGHASLKRVHYQSGKFALGNLLAAALVKDKSVLSPKFLTRYLTFTKDRLIVPLMTGAANMSISVSRLATVPVDFPPLAEQERIVKLLDGADEVRKLRDQAGRRTTALIPALFDEMFGDPVKNPFGLPVIRLTEVLEATPNYGTMIPARADEGDWLSLRVANIQAGGLDLTDRKFVNLPNEMLERHTVRDGDLLLARAIGSKEHLGKCVVVNPGKEKWAFDSHLMRIRLNHQLCKPEWLKALFESNGGRQLFLNNTRQSAVQFNINAKEFGSILVPLPPAERQDDFLQKVSEIRELEAAQAISRRRSDSLFQSMLHRAFNGEL